MDPQLSIFPDQTFEAYQPLSGKTGNGNGNGNNELMSYLPLTNESDLFYPSTNFAFQFTDSASSDNMSSSSDSYLMSVVNAAAAAGAFVDPMDVADTQTFMDQATTADLAEFVDTDVFQNENAFQSVPQDLLLALAIPTFADYDINYNDNSYAAALTGTDDAFEPILTSISPQSSFSNASAAAAVTLAASKQPIFNNYMLALNEANLDHIGGTRNNSVSSFSSNSSSIMKPPGEVLKKKKSKKSTLPSSGSSSPKENQLRDKSGKRHSDSRLSLTELANFLNLSEDTTETMKREQEVLTIFKDELGFELGLKTWVRDTSAAKRQQLVKDLTAIVEERFHYGYSEKTIEVIVRRASYYTMQGRLRRERRNEQKQEGVLVRSDKAKRMKSVTGQM